MGGSLGLGLVWFLLILAAIPAVLWLLKRTPYGAAMSGVVPGHARTIGSLALGPQQRLVTVEVGQGEDRRWLVLGVAPQSVTLLHTLVPQEDAAAPAGPGAPTSLDFAGLLDRLRRGNHDKRSTLS